MYATEEYLNGVKCLKNPVVSWKKLRTESVSDSDAHMARFTTIAPFTIHLLSRDVL